MKNTPTLLRGATMASCLLFAGTAMAQMSPIDYNAGKGRIKDDYSTGKNNCMAAAKAKFGKM